MQLIKRPFVSLLVALACTSTIAVAATPMSYTYPIKAQNGSGEAGAVTLTEAGDKTTVVVTLTGAPADPQPAHIHPGTCADLNPAPKYPLSNVVAGKSTTTVPATLASLTSATTPMSVNVHKSTSDLKDYVACGQIFKGDAMSGHSMSGSAMSGHSMPAATSSP